MSSHVTALFRERWTAHAAVQQLVQSSFSRDDISVLMSERTHGRDFSARSGTRSREGAAPGGVLGAIALGMVPLELGSAVFGAGPLVNATAAAGRGELRATLVERLVQGGVAASDAELASGRLSAGAILVGVRIHDRPELARLAQQVLALAGGDSSKAA